MDQEPDRDLVRRWELALTEIAARETADRGITELTSVNGGAPDQGSASAAVDIVPV